MPEDFELEQLKKFIAVKNPELSEPEVEQEWRKQAIGIIKQALNAEYKNLGYMEAGWATIGSETGNKKYDDLNKQYVELQFTQQKEEPTQNPGLIQQFSSAIGNGASGLQYVWEVAQILPVLKQEYNNFNNLRTATNSEDRTNKVCQMIKDGGPLFQTLSNILNSPTISASSKATILDYATPKLNPLLNKLTANLTSKFYTKEEKPNLLKNVSPDFNRKLITILADLGANALKSDLNTNIQNIYRELTQKENQSLPNILENVKAIISSDKFNEFIKKDLSEFLLNPENQKEVAKITANILNNEAKQVITPKLLENTVSLVLKQSDEVLKNAPEIINIYQDFNRINTVFQNSLLASEGNLPKNSRDLLIDGMKQHTQNLLNNTQTLVNNLSPIIAENLPKYLLENREGVISLLNTLKVPEKIKATGISDEVSKNTVEALPELMADIAPMVTKIMQSSLKERENFLGIVQQAQALKLAPAGEKKIEIKKLISSILEFEKNNPELKNTIETELPKILDKHSKTLAPLVEEFLNKTPIGKKLKLEGEQLIKIAQKHTPELTAIAKALNEKKYGSMIGPSLKLLADPVVLDTLATSAINLTRYQISKLWGGNKPILGKHTQALANNDNSPSPQQSHRKGV